MVDETYDEPEITPPREGNFNLTNLQLTAVLARVAAELKEQQKAGNKLAVDRPGQFREDVLLAIKGTGVLGEAAITHREKIEQLAQEYAKNNPKSGLL